MKALVASERYQEELNVRFIVAENNRVVKLKCYISLIKKLINFPQALTGTIFFNALLTNGGIGKGIADTGKGIKKNDINVM